MSKIKIILYLKALGFTMLFMIVLSLISSYFGWEDRFLVGWFSCMIWGWLVEHYQIRQYD
jgi:hypothetical protein